MCACSLTQQQKDMAAETGGRGACNGRRGAVPRVSTCDLRRLQRCCLAVVRQQLRLQTLYPSGRSEAHAAACVARSPGRTPPCGARKPQPRHGTHGTDLHALRSLLIRFYKLPICHDVSQTHDLYDSVRLQPGLTVGSRHLVAARDARPAEGTVFFSVSVTHPLLPPAQWQEAPGPRGGMMGGSK